MKNIGNNQKSDHDIIEQFEVEKEIYNLSFLKPSYRKTLEQAGKIDRLNWGNIVEFVYLFISDTEKARVVYLDKKGDIMGMENMSDIIRERIAEKVRKGVVTYIPKQSLTE